jgi:hypothetical protein
MEEKADTREMDLLGIYRHTNVQDFFMEEEDEDSWAQIQRDALDSLGSHVGGGQTQKLRRPL